MLWFESEMLPAGSCAGMLAAQMVALSGKVVRPLGCRASLEEVGYWDKP